MTAYISNRWAHVNDKLRPLLSSTPPTTFNLWEIRKHAYYAHGQDVRLAFVGSLGHHWIKQMSWLASILKGYWMASLSLIVMPLQLYWHRIERLGSQFTLRKQKEWAEGPEGRQGAWLIWLVMKLLPPFDLQISTATIMAIALSLMNWSQFWSLGKWVMWTVEWWRVGINQHPLCIILHVRCGCGWGGAFIYRTSVFITRVKDQAVDKQFERNTTGHI